MKPMRFASELVAVVVVLAMCSTPATMQPDASASEAAVRAAILASVRARMGEDVDVTMRDLRVRIAGETPAQVAATPDIGARTGGFIRFMLFDGAADDARTNAPRGRRIGTADVHVSVSAPHVRASHALTRGAVVTNDDVETVTDDIGRQPLKPLPDVGRIVGARTVRAVEAGETLSAPALALRALVQSGDTVTTRVRIGELEARGSAVAAQTGSLGDEIVLVNADSRRRLKGRVVGAREVEVLHER